MNALQTLLEESSSDEEYVALSQVAHVVAVVAEEAVLSPDLTNRQAFAAALIKKRDCRSLPRKNKPRKKLDHTGALNCIKRDFDGNHIPPHGPNGAGSKGSVSSHEWQVVNRAKRKWASVWRPITTNPGYQMVITREGYIIPLQVKDGLCYMKMRPPTDEELSSLPHVIMTSDDEWNPSAVDNDGPNLEGIENHADVVRIREQQDRRIDNLRIVVELDIKQVVQSP